jgi:hypothetical protein
MHQHGDQDNLGGGSRNIGVVIADGVAEFVGADEAWIRRID